LNSPGIDISSLAPKRLFSVHKSTSRSSTHSTAHDQHGSSDVACRIEAKRIFIFILGLIRSGDYPVTRPLALLRCALLALLPPRTQPRAVDLDTADATHGMRFGTCGAASQYQHRNQHNKSVHPLPYARQRPTTARLIPSLVANRRLIRLKKQTTQRRDWFHQNCTQPYRTNSQAQKRATEVALFHDQAELSSVWPLLDAAVPP